MTKERKLKCYCGKILEEKETILEHIQTNALVCPSCGFTTLTKDQAKEFQKLLEFHNAMDQEKQIIKI